MHLPNNAAKIQGLDWGNIQGVVNQRHPNHMLHTVVVLLGELQIGSEHIQDFELFDASNIDIEQQRWYAKHIIKFCSKRTNTIEAAFLTKIIKVTDPKLLKVKFGLAVLVSADLISEDELSKIKIDIGELAPRLNATRADQPQLDFQRPEMPCKDREVLDTDIKDSLMRLRSEFGGKRLPIPIEIRTDDHLLAKIEHVVLTRPDQPALAFDERLTGSVKRIRFGSTTWCDLREQKGAAGAGRPPRKITVLIETDALLDAVYAVARAHDLATFVLKRHEHGGRESCIELLSIQVEKRNISPLCSLDT